MRASGEAGGKIGVAGEGCQFGVMVRDLYVPPKENRNSGSNGETHLTIAVWQNDLSLYSEPDSNPSTLQKPYERRWLHQQRTIELGGVGI